MSKRFKYEDVQESFKEKNWELVSKEYKNKSSDLIALCPNGHENHLTFEEWRRKDKEYQCPICCYSPIIKINEKPQRKTGFRILGLDQATRTSGWAIMDDTNLVNYGAWTAKSESDLVMRISEIKTWLNIMIEKHKPDMVVFEDIQLQKIEGSEAVVTYKMLAQLQGVLENYCYENGIMFKVVHPAVWRKHAGVMGKTRTDKKKSAQLKVEQLYNINTTQDQADAILITRFAAYDRKKYEMISF